MMNINHCLSHRFISSLSDWHPSSEILMRAPVAALPSGHSVAASFDTLRPDVCRSLVFVVTPVHGSVEKAAATVDPTLVKILPGLALRILSAAIFSIIWRWAVEIVKHQVHVCSLFLLKVIDNCFISMNLYLYIGFSLPWQSSWFMEVALLTYAWCVKSVVFPDRRGPATVVVVLQLLLLLLMPLSLLLRLLVVTNVKGLPTNSGCRRTNMLRYLLCATATNITLVYLLHSLLLCLLTLCEKLWLIWELLWLNSTIRVKSLLPFLRWVRLWRRVIEVVWCHCELMREETTSRTPAIVSITILLMFMIYVCLRWLLFNRRARANKLPATARELHASIIVLL